MLVADDLPCGAMEPREAVESGAAQDSVDGGAGDAQPPPDAVRSPGKHASCSTDGRFLQLIGLAGAAQGTAGAVKERVRSAFTEPPHPLGDGRAGDAEQAGHFGLGPASPHLFDQLGAGHGGQACVTMSHEGPPVAAGFGYTTATAGPLTCQQPLWELQLAARNTSTRFAAPVYEQGDGDSVWVRGQHCPKCTEAVGQPLQATIASEAFEARSRDESAPSLAAVQRAVAGGQACPTARVNAHAGCRRMADSRGELQDVAGRPRVTRNRHSILSERRQTATPRGPREPVAGAGPRLPDDGALG